MTGTDWIELCCLCEIQHEGAEMETIAGDLYCPTCAKKCTCSCCEEKSVVPLSTTFELVVTNGSISKNQAGYLCQECAEEV
jgi:hypothetical protein